MQVSSVQGTQAPLGWSYFVLFLLEILAKTSTSHPEWIQTLWAAQGGAWGAELDGVCGYSGRTLPVLTLKDY